MSMTEKEIDLQMKKALEKVPFEIRKIKFVLSLLKIVKRIKKIFKF
ncbi:MAG: hypothetical protein ACRDAG_08720 [Cetobacterium somerae]|uniref:Uncharacterized protein n=1 Tax=Cetobacterium somerae ATCC BAA-474 TaxID=1319815 RepID=U7VCM8_9FUSO|nr:MULTISPECIES: hypothetical protein [Cetobacterium]ERT68894.1 hypothetical protein HMPREF0202_01218 [Cetobacterium somerae ATCC BAA-474]MBC2853541.1 hypothetical protein [Cetobacterium sp. 2G large]MCQ9626524.1 hypothetical protein [Cetobacterium somerae]